MADAGAQRTKRCESCGGHYLLDFFRLANAKATASAGDACLYRNRCIGCEMLFKRREQADERFRRKARGTLSRHGAKLKEEGKIKEQGDLEEFYGWSIDTMIKDIKHVLKEGCSYCRQGIDITEQGLGGITLDICDPQKPPHYSTNVEWCCARCNSEKQQTLRDVWGARLSMWDRWRRHRDRVDDDPAAYGFLTYEKAAGQSSLF
jgi:hypothetical protein